MAAAPRTAALLATQGFFYYVGRQMRRRIVPNRGGALMALDADGVRELSALYAVPTFCGDRNFQKTANYLTSCLKATRITSERIKKGLVLLPAETRGVATDTRYILSGGKFAPSSYFIHHGTRTKWFETVR
jgi:hypothetical protein